MYALSDPTLRLWSFRKYGSDISKRIIALIIFICNFVCWIRQRISKVLEDEGGCIDISDDSLSLDIIDS